MTDQESQRRVRATQTSFKITKSPKECNIDQQLYKRVMEGIAKNCKVGPFRATSGIVIPYYLNATTNFLDKTIAPSIVQLLLSYMQNVVKPLLPSGNERVLACGMEVAGGIMISQLAAAANEKVNSWCDFVYVRKERKSSGTQQQLEGPQFITKRDSSSEPIYGIWIDDALSTGGSMKEGIEMMKNDYNVHVVCALYLVDRSKDRRELSPQHQQLAHPMFDNIHILAPYDLSDIDQLFEEYFPEQHKRALEES